MVTNNINNYLREHGLSLSKTEQEQLENLANLCATVNDGTMVQFLKKYLQKATLKAIASHHNISSTLEPNVEAITKQSSDTLNRLIEHHNVLKVLKENIA